MLDLKNVIRELREEFARAQSELRKLDSAIAGIENAAATNFGRAGRHDGKAKDSESRPRVFSAVARRRISQAQKARWAKFRADKKERAS